MAEDMMTITSTQYLYRLYTSFTGTTTDEMDDLNPIVFVQRRVLPLTTTHYTSIQFDSDAR